MDTQRLFNEHYNDIITQATKYVGNEYANDVAQSLFEKLHKSNLEYDYVIDFLKMLVKRQCLSFIKTNKNYLSLQDGFVSNIKANDHIERIVIRKTFIEFLYNKICELPGRCGECMKLYYFEELNICEISNRLHISESSVTTHLYEGRKKIKMLSRYFD